MKPCRVSWWHAGGLHVHVTHPDGSWERHCWPAGEWWNVDAVVREMERRYGRPNVWVTP